MKVRKINRVYKRKTFAKCILRKTAIMSQSIEFPCVLNTIIFKESHFGGRDKDYYPIHLLENGSLPLSNNAYD